MEPEITLCGNCPGCRELILLGTEKCRYCGLELDQEQLYQSAIRNFVITQAISSANTIRTFDLAVFFFLGCTAILYLGDYGIRFEILATSCWLSPLVLIARWYFKHGRWPTDDEEYQRSKKEMRSGFFLWTATHFLNAMAILVMHKTA
ncbi:MAG TPA: hypothetical protein VJ302_18530 [Blastocatellia bacterium]|nr:hypothetical protein [Blastocatellia bacterium]